MPLGFRKTLRESRNAVPDKRPAQGSRTPDRAVVLGEVEELGIGMFWATDAEGNLSFLSSRALADLGAGAEDLIGKPLVRVFNDIDEEAGGATQRSLSFKLKARSKLDEQIVAVCDARGSTRWWRLNGRPLLDAEGGFKGYRGSAVDISAQYAYETQVARQSQVDELTGLANRRKLGERLSAMLAAFRVSRRSCALMMLDLARILDDR